MKKRLLNRRACLILALALIFAAVVPCSAQADTRGSKSTGISYQIQAVGEYQNWDGVSNVSQFTDEKGNYCFAYDKTKSVVIVKTKNGRPAKKTIKLKKKYPLFGGVICDGDGNYYLVTGRENKTDDTEKNTIFVSKYDKNGKLQKTVGDNGRSSLGYWYDNTFNTKIPFDAGNCDLAVNGNYLVVNYAREMYSGHQSNSVLTLDVTTMKKVNVGNIYSSHSFAQRAVPYGSGFVLASEGDCYSRAFTVTTITDMASQTCKNDDIFHFWVKKGTLDKYDMYVLNDNFAHMGGLAAAGDGSVALVGSSVKALSKKAASQNEQLFIQIFDPAQPLDAPASYATSGERSGSSGGNGDEKVTDYGVKWLTGYPNSNRISHPQVVATDSGKFVVLYELYEGSKYNGIYYIVLHQNGTIVKKKTKYSSSAYLNPCEMPVCTNGTIYWTGNKYNDTKYNLYVYSLKIE